MSFNYNGLIGIENTIIGIAATIAVGVFAILWAVRSRYTTVRWKGIGRRVFWFSLLFILPAAALELAGKYLPELLKWIGLPGFEKIWNGGLYSFLLMVAIVGVAEETAKFLAIVAGTKKFRRVASSLDLVGYAFISAGAFTALENLEYYIIYSLQMHAPATTIAVTRAVVSSPVHLTCTVLPILGFLRSRETGKKKYTWLYLAMAAAVHGLFDFLLTYFVDGDISSSLNLLVILIFGSFLLVAMIFMIINCMRTPKQYAKRHTAYCCRRCGYPIRTLLPRCPNCGGTKFLRVVTLPPLPPAREPQRARSSERQTAVPDPQAPDPVQREG